MSKLIYAASKAGLQALIDKSAEDKLKVDSALAFTDDGYFYTHGKYFKLPTVGNHTYTPSYSGTTVTLTDYAGDTITFDRGAHDIKTTGPITGTLSDGAITIAHANSGVSATTGLGSSTSASIAFPKLSVDAKGHVTAIESVSATINRVRTTARATNAEHFITFGTSDADSTSELYTDSQLKYNPSTNTLTAGTYIGSLNNSLKISLNGATTEFNNSAARTVSFYAPSGKGSQHQILQANASGIPAWVSLQSSIASTSKDYEIPSALAVFNAIKTGITANDAMIFKGFIDASTNPNYPAASVGHTWKISKAGKIGGASGIEVEIGDTIICTTDTAAGTHALVGVNWGVIQTNLITSTVGLKLLSIVNPTSANSYIKVEADGSVSYKTLADIKSDMDLDQVENTKLSTWKGTNKITTVGTITTGTWSGSTIAVNRGGTGATSFTSNGVLYGNGTGAIKATAVNAGTKQFLTQASSGAPTWSGIVREDLPSGSLTSGDDTNVVLTITNGANATMTETKVTASWSGTLSETRGGTGLGTYAAGDLIYATALNKLGILKKGADGQVLKLSEGVPIWGTDNNTHYVSNLVVTNSATGKANAASTNGSTRINLIENNAVKSSHIIQGSDSVSVTSNSSGHIVISSPNTWRDVTARGISSTTVASIGLKDLKFGEEFIWESNELKLGWAEVSSTGVVTYAV